jgi:hypothetical protein
MMAIMIMMMMMMMMVVTTTTTSDLHNIFQNASSSVRNHCHITSLCNVIFSCKFSGFHDGECSDCGVLGCNIILEEHITISV